MALTPQEIDGLRELILAIYGPICEELLRDLCRCITAAGGVTSSAEYRLLLAKSLAGADDVIADTLRRQTDLTNDAVEQLMRWAAEKTAPLEENESLQNIAEAYVKVARNEVAHVLGQLAAADVDGKVYSKRRQQYKGCSYPNQRLRRTSPQQCSTQFKSLLHNEDLTRAAGFRVAFLFRLCLYWQDLPVHLSPEG